MVTATRSSCNPEASYIICAPVLQLYFTNEVVDLFLRWLAGFAMSSAQIDLGPNAAEFM